MAGDRMRASTPSAVTDRIALATEAHVREAADRGELDRRLAELDAEWDVERALFTMTGLNVLLGAALTRFVDRRWLGYLTGVAAFQVQHGIQGWCPPLALLRRLGLRTRAEIDEERTALRALRGDFESVDGSPERALAIARSNGSGA